MIKLERGTKPIELTETLQNQLTDEFKKTGQSVWNIDFLKKALTSYSNDKCCYCEADISEESKYLEVEHFHPKTLYDDQVLDWENLLPCCKRCNGTKNNHDTVLEPIIDPTNLNPKDYLMLWNFRFKSKSEIGNLTISVLDLNNQDRLLKKRFEIGSAIHFKIEQLNELCDDYINGIQNSTRRKNRIINGLKGLMKEGLPSAIYSATSSTVIITDDDYKVLKEKITNIKLWDSELSRLEMILKTIALELYQ